MCVACDSVINTAFDGAATTAAGVELLDAFSSLAKREAIKRCVEKKSSEVFTSFTQELLYVKKQFDKQKSSPPVIHRDHPRFAGAALWAKSWYLRIQQQWMLLEHAQSFLPATNEAEQAHAVYQLLDASLHEYIRKMYSEWITTIESGIGRFLDNFLMVRSQQPLQGASGRERYGYLEQNFDRTLLQLFAEVHYWEKLRFEIPYVAMDIATHRERYRCLRENVMLVVRDYNSILTALSPAERRLFTERLHYLDRKIVPGLTKLTWASKGITDQFLK